MKNCTKVIFLSLIIFSNTLFAKNLDKVSLQLQWLDQFQFAGYYIAKEKGFYKDVGLDVEIKKFHSGIVPVDEIVSKKSTYGIGRSSLIIDKSNGKNISILSAIFQSSPSVLIARKDSNIKSVNDFAGKRVMITSDAADMVSTKAMLNKFGVTINDIIKLKHSFNIKDLIDKKTDLMAVYLSNEPFLLKQNKTDVTIFDPKDYGFDFYNDILFTSEDEINNHKNRVENFTGASLKGWKYAFAHIDETVDLILKKYNAQNKSKEALIYEANVLKKLAYYKTKKLGKIDKHKIQRIYDVYNVMGWTKNSIDIDEFIYKDVKNTIYFTAKEQKYLNAHPIIKAHNETNWAPFNFNEDGKAKGFSIDYMNLVASKIGIDVEYISGYSWAEFMDILPTPKLDVMINIAKSKEREKTIAFTDSYYRTYNAIYVNKKGKKVTTLQELSGKTIAITKGFFTQQLLSKYYPDIKQVLVKNQVESLKLLSLNKVDAVIGKKVIMDYLIEENNIPNIVVTNYTQDKRIITKLRFGVSKQDTLLRDILQKAKQLISDEEMRKLKSKWFGVKTKFKSNTVVFTKKEKQYLQNKKEILICVDPSRLPFKDVQNGKYIGISADYFKLFQNNLDIPIHLVETKSWTDTLETIKNKKCDIITIAVSTPSRKAYLNFTTPYLQTPLVLVTKSDQPFITNLSAIDKKLQIGIPKSYAFIELLRQKYPNFNIVEVENIEDGLQKVVKGENFAYIGTSLSVGYKLKKNFIKLLKVSGQFTDTYKLSVAVRNDEILLLDIFNKLVKNVDQTQHNTILKNWTFDIQKTQDYTLIWEISGVSLFFILLVLYRQNEVKKNNLKLKKAKNELDKLNNTLKDKVKNATKDLLRAQKLAKIGSWRLKFSNNKLSWSDEVYNIFEIDKNTEKISKIENFMKYIHPDDLETITTAYDNHIKDQIPYLLLHRIITKKGNIKYVEERCVTKFDTDGNPLVSNGTVQDITEKKIQEIELQKKDQQMLHQSRLAQMGEMISMIAHQWRQPLNAISLTSSNLKFKCMMDQYDKNIFEKEIDLICEYSEHLSKTIDDFRGFFKDNKVKETTTLENIVNSTLEIVKVSVENKNIKIITSFNSNEEIETYPNELKQVVLNLIKNSEDILLENKISNPTITIKTSLNNELTVSDNAGGIPEDIKDKIFDPYFSTKLEKDGTGLGLYMSKTIIEEHCGGKLSVENDSEGAVFTIKFNPEVDVICGKKRK